MGHNRLNDGENAVRTFHRFTRILSGFTMACLALQGQSSGLDGKQNPGGEKPSHREPASHAVRHQTLEQWIERLAVAESRNRPRSVHQDRDGKYNYGCLQFREKTFRSYVEKFDLAPDARPEEVMDLIYDCAFQKRLAARMIRDNPENWRHWRKTVRRIGLPPVPAATPNPAASDASARLKLPNKSADQ